MEEDCFLILTSLLNVNLSFYFHIFRSKVVHAGSILGLGCDSQLVNYKKFVIIELVRNYIRRKDITFIDSKRVLFAMASTLSCYAICHICIRRIFCSLPQLFLVAVTNFREATCRQYEENTCNRGCYCNFMHLKRISRQNFDFCVSLGSFLFLEDGGCLLVTCVQRSLHKFG